MRTLHHPSVEEMKLSSVLYALSDPIRLEIVRAIGDGQEMSCGGFGLDLAKSTMSHHFKVLREAGVVRTRIEGTQRFMSLRREDLDRLFPGLIQSVLAAEGPL